MRAAELTSAIEHLTQDDDERQELWVHCLLDTEDRSIDDLSAYLADIRRTFSEDELLQVTVWRSVSSASHAELLSLFDQFTDLEQSVMRLLAIGASLQQISGITSVGEVRLRHVISIIRENEAWKDFNGTEG